jgi:uncharacterized protein (DUF983 family)
MAPPLRKTLFDHGVEITCPNCGHTALYDFTLEQGQ